MACCPACRRRAALIAALAPAISSLSLNREGLLSLLALPNEQLLRATKVKNPSRLPHSLQPPLPTDTVPTALCRPTDPGGPCMLGLLRDGATPVACASDVLELLGERSYVREAAAEPVGEPAAEPAVQAGAEPATEPAAV